MRRSSAIRTSSCCRRSAQGGDRRLPSSSSRPPATGPKEQFDDTRLVPPAPGRPAKALVVGADDPVVQPRSLLRQRRSVPAIGCFPRVLWDTPEVSLRFDILEELPRRFSYAFSRKAGARASGWLLGLRTELSRARTERAAALRQASGGKAACGFATARARSVGGAPTVSRCRQATRGRRWATGRDRADLVLPPSYTNAIPPPGTEAAYRDRRLQGSARSRPPAAMTEQASSTGASSGRRIRIRTLFFDVRPLPPAPRKG